MLNKMRIFAPRLYKDSQMANKYLIKNAWFITHETLGDIMCFVATPKVETSPNSLGYYLDNRLDEVFRFPGFAEIVENIIPKMDVIGNDLWQMPAYGDLIEVEFNLSDFNDQLIFQANYGREVLFHTSKDCFE